MSPATLARPTEAERIADQLERAFAGDAWHGPSLSEILAAVTAEQAAARPLAAAHTILEIVLHLTAWLRTVRRRLQGEPVAALPDEEDWPAPLADAGAAWAEAARALRAEYEELREESLRWVDRDLETRLAGERYTVYEMLHGVVQHSLYHAGQIVLLARAGAEAR